jgi:CBS domain-containing protein
MKVRELMTKQVIRIHPDEPVAVAARTLTQYNIGALPVCGRDGQLYGMVTDRDLVIRCMAAGRDPGSMKVRDVMTGGVVSTSPDAEIGVAAHLMGHRQVRRLPVVENGKLCGMVSLGDLAGREESVMDAADALTDISENIRLNER